MDFRIGEYVIVGNRYTQGQASEVELALGKAYEILGIGQFSSQEPAVIVRNERGNELTYSELWFTHAPAGRSRPQQN